MTDIIEWTKPQRDGSNAGRRINEHLIFKHLNDSLNGVFDILGKVESEVARIFSCIADVVVDELWVLDEEIIFTDKGSGPLKDRLKPLKDKLITSGEDINVIPDGQSGQCHRICYTFMLDKWEAEKGFKGICEKLTTYWLKCAKTNLTTIILTTAWDEIDFTENYQERFDSYASDHNIVVILISFAGCSICYMK